MNYPRYEDDMERFWNEQAAWSNATFGDEKARGPMGPLKHLLKEANECISAAQFVNECADSAQRQAKEDLQTEIADGLFLVFDAARRSGLTYQTLLEKAFAKLEVNKKREWPKPTSSDEPVEHDRTKD